MIMDAARAKPRAAFFPRGAGDMIEVRNLNKHFGGFHAVDGASLRIETGSITGLIGPNGA